MSSVTELDALADLVDLIDSVSGIKIDADTEPAEVRNAQAVVELSGGTTTDYRYRVKVYARGGSTKDVQTRLRGYRQGIEDALRTTAQFVMVEYTYASLSEANDAWVVDFEVSTGREDF